MSSPTTDDLASVLAAVISSDRVVESLREKTGLPGETVQAVIADLMQRGLLRGMGDGRYHVSQSLCAGPCSRGGRGLQGQEVVVNTRTLRWTCAACWDAEGPGASQ
jgi:hypothetical protein